MTRAKQQPRAMSPVGVASLLPERARLQRRLEATVIDHFTRAGYQEVIPPLVEYLDVIAPVLGGELVERAYTFADRATGRLMVLRPDVTPQIARMVAQLLADQREPLRFCYRATVFRHEEAHAGREREVMQIGAELIGPSDASADAEIIVLALSSLEKLGISGVQVALGHPGVFEGLLEGIDVTDAVVRELRDALSRRDRAELVALARHTLPPTRAGRLEALIDSIGSADVLTEAAKRGEEEPHGKTADALRRLGDIYRLIDKAGYGRAVLIDLGEVRGFDYYTGMVFDLFVKGVGYEIGGGGRYDQLIGRFGVDRPSTGFAFSATPLLHLLTRREEEGRDGGKAPGREGRHGR
ncbi:MAG TPA: ATP phosphoribosyltransferase regulatory subunit [Nitrospiria bacterium]|nr:ATP phosphoribosyltransferase regulatory subunit [Nitrospiria bacterium]